MDDSIATRPFLLMVAKKLGKKAEDLEKII